MPTTAHMRAPLRGCGAWRAGSIALAWHHGARACRKAYKLVFHNQGKALYEGAVRRTMRQPPSHGQPCACNAGVKATLESHLQTVAERIAAASGHLLEVRARCLPVRTP